ncbi:MAG: hypothetical protein JXR31_13100, partial [Prolixibacteraceae bacterium]|nr:hypothetical protein [Prolixibacteraceae bacterium]
GVCLTGFMLVFCLLLTFGFSTKVYSQESNKENCFYSSSLHFTANGMKYWYGKEQGGLESVIDVPYEKAGCTKCHVASCDACHKTIVDGKPVYSTEEARKQETCLKCHARESSMILKIDKNANTPDVHVQAGMTCVDCHTSREFHGDGVEYQSMKQHGAMDVKCTNCHESVSESQSHTVHGDKLDCNACHVRHVLSCTNCHVETMVKTGKRVAVPVSGWKFLMNYEGKVTAANMQTFLAPENKTLLMFAPQFSHSVKKEGDKCEDCHASDNVKMVLKKEINLTWLEDGTVKQTKGIFPVVDGVKYNTVFQDYKDEVWTPIEKQLDPKIQYVGYGTPLTKEQMEKLSEKVESN